MRCESPSHSHRGRVGRRTSFLSHGCITRDRLTINRAVAAMGLRDDVAMGKKSRLKRERRARNAIGVVGVVRPLSRDSMQALLESASASPTSNFVLPSISSAFCAFAQQRRHGQVPAHPDHLRQLVEAAHREFDDLERLEDFVPGDAQLEAFVPWAGSLHRILPGGLSQPLSIVDEARLLASVIDPVLTRALGYGLTDAVELVLRRVSLVARTLAAEWEPREEQDIGKTPSVSPGVLSSAHALVGSGFAVAECSDPARAQKALDRFSVPARRLSDGESRPSLGSAVAVIGDQDRAMPVPAGLLMESIPALMSDLSRQARDLAPESSGQWAAEVARCLKAKLNGAGHPVVGVRLDQHGSPNVLYVRYSSHQVLTLGIAASLDARTIQHTMEATAFALGDSGDPEVPRELLERGVVDPQARPEALQIIACPVYPLELRRGTVRAMTLKDLLWMLRTAADPTDLWRYARDIREAEQTTVIVAMDEADAWQWWCKNGKCLHVGGVELPVSIVEPGIQLDEWDMATGLSVLEAALLPLGLPPASAWPRVEFHEGICVVRDAMTGCQYRIIPTASPVAIGWAPEAWNGDDALEVLVDGITNKLEHLSPLLAGWLADAHREGLRVDFVKTPDNAGPAVGFVSISGNVLTLAWNDSLRESMMVSGAQVEHEAGIALARGVVALERMPEFVEAWSATPRSMRMDMVSYGRRTVPTSRAVTLRAAGDSRIRRELAVYMRKQDVDCREYAGDDAKRLDSGLIYTWLMDRLRAELDHHSPRDLLLYALVQFELLNYERDLADRTMELYLGLPDRRARGEEYIDSLRSDAVLHSRYVSLIVELIIASPPTGTARPNVPAWEHLLSIAALCVESGFRSETVHLGLSDSTLTVSGHYELLVDEGSRVPLFDMQSYLKHWTESTRPPEISLDEGGATSNEDAGSDGPLMVLDLIPGMEAVDSALQETFGFGLEALVGVLQHAHAWESDAKTGVHIAEVDQFAESAAAIYPAAITEEYRCAVDWLTLDSIDLHDIEPWELERRADRIATRPFVKHDDGIYVLPWTANAALKVLFNYLDDGRLPWPEEMLTGSDEQRPGEVVKTLNAYRQKRNLALEKEAVPELEALGLTVLPGVKPHKRHKFGITNLSGEVDLICIDPQRSAIWVVEVKDPYGAYSARLMRRIVSDFHADGGYVDKLLNKCNEISVDACAIAAIQGIALPDRQWETRGIMATRALCPAAFVDNSRVAFCLVEELPTAIRT